MTFDPSNALRSGQGFFSPNLVAIGHFYGKLTPKWPLTPCRVTSKICPQISWAHPLTPCQVSGQYLEAWPTDPRWPLHDLWPQQCTTLWSMVLFTKFGNHRAFLRQIDPRMTFDPWSGRFQNMPTNLVGPSPTPMPTFSSVHRSMAKRIAGHTHTHIHTHTHRLHYFSSIDVHNLSPYGSSRHIWADLGCCSWGSDNFLAVKLKPRLAPVFWNCCPVEQVRQFVISPHLVASLSDDIPCIDVPVPVLAIPVYLSSLNRSHTCIPFLAPLWYFCFLPNMDLSISISLSNMMVAVCLIWVRSH